MDSRKSLDLNAVFLMILICSIWAIQQIGLKMTASYAAPVLQIGLRSIIAAVCVWIFIRIRRQTIVFTGEIALAGMAAGLLFAFEFLLVGESIKHTTASHVVVFLYTAPIFAGLGLHLKIPSERLSAVQWGGILVAAAGIAVAFLGHDDAAATGDLASMLLGDSLALAAGATWGATTIVIRTTALSRIPGAHTLFYQLATAGVLLTGAAILMGESHIEPAWILVIQLAFQAFVVSFFSFLVWFYLLTQYKASQLGVFSFMTPLIGVVLGYAILSEPLTHAFMLGSAGVMTGIIAVSAYPWFRQRREARQAKG